MDYKIRESFFSSLGLNESSSDLITPAELGYPRSTKKTPSGNLEPLSLQEQQRQIEKLAAIGRFVAGVAHEINNPLCVARGYAQLAHEQILDLKPAPELLLEKQKQLLQQNEKITAALKRCQLIINDLLTFAQADDGSQQELELSAVVRDALWPLKPRCDQQHIAIVTQLDPSIKIEGNAHGLYQAITNILVNAIQAMKLGGQLEVRVLRCPLAKPLEQTAPTITTAEGCIEIIDSGEGIDPTHLDCIFDPFFTTKGIGEGSGLGLSIAHGIVEKLGGKITVESQLGCGSKFTIHLPQKI